jgi:dolichyl-phosphate beta-glucosyltransferase
MFLSIIIPCYNEKENLKRGVLDEVNKYLQKQNYNWEVIISDDGSSDQSLEFCQQFSEENTGFRVLANQHGGKPWAVWKGIEAASGDWVLFTDMDQSTPIDQVEKLLPWFNQYDLVIGSRGAKRQGFSMIRKIGSSVFRFLRGLILLPQINDTQCGFKAMRKQVGIEIFPKLEFFQNINKKVKGWKVTAFDIEMLFLAEKYGYKIKEVSVKWQDRDAAAESKKKSYLKESKQMLAQVIRVRINDLKGKYD